MEVLTAFVRQNAPIIKENESQSPEDQEKLLKLRISIRACLTVIAERKHPDLENKYIDLTEVNISGLNLARFNLTGANLFVANLKQAKLTGAVLAGANLTEAVLAGANLTEAVLTRANLTRANLRGAYRFKPDWTEVLLTEVLLTEADLEGAILKGATMPDGSIHN
jgi:uncharacterized protein YjbI with pentapeptide repeats